MSTKRAAKIETPGEPHATEAEAPPAVAAPTDTSQPEAAAVSEVAAAESAEAAPAPVAPSPAVANSAATDAAKDAKLAVQVEKTKGLVGSPAALDWSHLTQPAYLQSLVGANAPDKDPNAHLPTVESINWANVAGDRILTKSGWLLRP